MNIKLCVAFIALVWLSGCATIQVSQSGFYWGKYSNTLYDFKNNPGDETRVKHIAELNAIILKSQELKLKVPPGIYAELGMYTLEDGNKDVANKLFNQELGAYPESKAMINQILKKG